MADIQPARIIWNLNNLDPNLEHFPSYRLDIAYINYVNHDLTYGEQIIPEYLFLLIVLDGGLYREVAPAEDYIRINDIIPYTKTVDVFNLVSDDITKPGYVFAGIYYDFEFDIPVISYDELTTNRTIFIKWEPA